MKRLLLHHGREAYRRNSYLICYNFYKNFICVLPNFWFAYHSAFSASFLYDQILFLGFNTAFTALPIVIYAVFDEEYTDKELIENPKLYRQGMKGLVIYKIKINSVKTFYSIIEYSGDGFCSVS